MYLREYQGVYTQRNIELQFADNAAARDTKRKEKKDSVNEFGEETGSSVYPWRDRLHMT